MYKHGTKIYYNLNTGEVLFIQLDRISSTTETSFEEDYKIIREINHFNVDEIGLKYFKHGEYSMISEGSTGVYVDLKTDELIFWYDPIPEPKQQPTWENEIDNKISILEAENATLREGLQAVLSGDMQSLAYILYPEDFTDVNNTTLEL